MVLFCACFFNGEISLPVAVQFFLHQAIPEPILWWPLIEADLLLLVMHSNTLCKIVWVSGPLHLAKHKQTHILLILWVLFRAMEKRYWSHKWFCKFTCKNISTRLISRALDHLGFPRTLTLYHFQLLIKEGKIKPRGYEAQQECQLATYLCAYSEIICFCVVPRHNC